jgi:CysZ protein
MTAHRKIKHSGLLAGPSALGAAFRLLLTRPELWRWCVLPMLLNLLLFAGAFAAFFGYLLDPLTAQLQSYLDVGSAQVWYEWLWIGPLRALAWALEGVLLALAALAVYMTFAIVGGVIASPFLDALSLRVERIYTGSAPEIDEPFLRTALRSMGDAARRAGFTLALLFGVLFVGLVPGLQPVAAVAGALVSAAFLALDYTSFAHDRRGITFRERRRWLWRNRSALLGFGAAGLLTLLVPGLNFVCLPWLVTAGTLLAADLGDARAEP